MNKKPYAGFSLVEMMVTLSIGITLTIIMAPNFYASSKNNYLIAQINSFNNALLFSRNQAIKNKMTVTICASIDKTTCSDLNNWERGWIIQLADSDNTIARVGEDLSEKISLRASNFSDNSTIQYDATGVLNDDSNRGTFTLCDERGATSSKALILNAVGRTATAYDQDDNGIVDDDAGADVSC